jgi:LPXTG-motif cell wall-anchored protein
MLFSLLLAAVLLVALAPASDEHAIADGTMPPTLTFEGSAGGGTIKLTTTADRTKVVAAFVEDVVFSCGPASGFAYVGPPAPVTAGNFRFDIGFWPPFNGFAFDGSFTGENTIQGTATWGYAIPNFSCASDPVPWTLTNPVETAPDPEDQSLVGSADGSPNTITVVTDPGQTQITALVLESVPIEACATEVDAIVPLVSPAPVGSINSLFQVSFDLAVTQTVIVSGTLNGQTAAGNLFFSELLQCSGEVEWSATLKSAPPAVGGIASDPDLAILESTQTGDSNQVSGTIAALLGSAALLALGGIGWYARRRSKRSTTARIT